MEELEDIRRIQMGRTGYVVLLRKLLILP